jgi:hypothetical protein
MTRALKRLKWRLHDWKDLVLPRLVCKLVGHLEPYRRMFGGELLCRRCSTQVGRWSR